MGKTKTKSRSVGDSPKPPITLRSTNPKIIDDNIAKLEKAIQAGDVSANPSGTAEETLLSTIGIDGKKYELGPSAENTSYDNTDSGLTAEDVQSAIDEVSSASGISYDNTDSGLTATDTQAAIDEIVTKTMKKLVDTTFSSEVYTFTIPDRVYASYLIIYEGRAYNSEYTTLSGSGIAFVTSRSATEDPAIMSIKTGTIDFISYNNNVLTIGATGFGQGVKIYKL